MKSPLWSPQPPATVASRAPLPPRGPPKHPHLSHVSNKQLWRPGPQPRVSSRKDKENLDKTSLDVFLSLHPFAFGGS